MRTKRNPEWIKLSTDTMVYGPSKKSIPRITLRGQQENPGYFDIIMVGGKRSEACDQCFIPDTFIGIDLPVPGSIDRKISKLYARFAKDPEAWWNQVEAQKAERKRESQELRKARKATWEEEEVARRAYIAKKEREQDERELEKLRAALKARLVEGAPTFTQLMAVGGVLHALDCNGNVWQRLAMTWVPLR